MSQLRSSAHALAAAALALLILPAAQAADWIPDRDLRSYCQQFLTRPSSPSGTVCVSWVQGFLDGIRSEESSAMLARHEPASANGDDDDSNDANGDDAGRSEFGQRAIETRAEALIDEYGPPARSGVCLPEDPDANVVARVVARGIVYDGHDLERQALNALRERYPCDVGENT